MSNRIVILLSMASLLLVGFVGVVHAPDTQLTVFLLVSLVAVVVTLRRIARSLRRTEERMPGGSVYPDYLLKSTMG